jgi:hypothetical protein
MTPEDERDAHKPGPVGFAVALYQGRWMLQPVLRGQERRFPRQSWPKLVSPAWPFAGLPVAGKARSSAKRLSRYRKRTYPSLPLQLFLSERMLTCGLRSSASRRRHLCRWCRRSRPGWWLSMSLRLRRRRLRRHRRARRLGRRGLCSVIDPGRLMIVCGCRHCKSKVPRRGSIGRAVGLLTCSADMSGLGRPMGRRSRRIPLLNGRRRRGRSLLRCGLLGSRATLGTLRSLWRLRGSPPRIVDLVLLTGGLFSRRRGSIVDRVLRRMCMVRVRNLGLALALARAVWVSARRDRRRILRVAGTRDRELVAVRLTL